uniref:Diphthine--ammonia ligase n=1 Tax=Timema shepardi TaxID=629360 RepID=A0A7R9AUI7_TIMSH|nr:unnamed protein product [Timema shepardi]
MRVVALISGGKDSCYNMVQCVAAGHSIVALANLRPHTKDELDSYMYQTVGHQGVELYAEAIGVPLFRQTTQGVAVLQEQVYTPTAEDEVEDLYHLLKKVKDEVDIDAVAVGAILSDYQRIRVENVCSRLGLVALAYLWRRDQGELLQEMIDCQIDAIVIKVAALGLDPAKHLGMTLVELQPHIIKMVIDKFETVIHSNDAIAPVGYLNFKKLHLVSKEHVPVTSSMAERIRRIPAKTWQDLLSDLTQESGDGKLTDHDEDSLEETVPPPPEFNSPLKCVGFIEGPLPDCPTSKRNRAGWCWLGGIIGGGECCAEATRQALRKLNTMIMNQGLSLLELVAVTLYVGDMSQYAAVNTEYLKLFRWNNPPVRICVETVLPHETPVMMEALACKVLAQDEMQSCDRHTMHVQGVSHWAPANIGPYSQAIRIGDIIYVAGQIALVPGTMQMIEGGVKKQCRLTLKHIGRIVKAMDPNTQLRDVVQGICYVTHPSYIPEARHEWEKKTNNAIVDYVVVSGLPRGALIEWHIWAHRHNNRVSIRRRWNYENNVSAVVCYVSTGTSTSTSAMTEEGKEPLSPHHMTDEDLSEVLCYTLSKLLRKVPPTTVCNLRVFFQVGKGIVPHRIQNVLNKAEGFNIVHTIVPVVHLHNPHTFLSLCGVRHD